MWDYFRNAEALTTTYTASALLPLFKGGVGSRERTCGLEKRHSPATLQRKRIKSQVLKLPYCKNGEENRADSPPVAPLLIAS